MFQPEHGCQASDYPFPGVWWQHGVSTLARQAAKFFVAYRAVGGADALDEINADWEVSMFGASQGVHLGSCPAPVNATAAGQAATEACRSCFDAKWRAIQADSRFGPVQQELSRLGMRLNSFDPDALSTAMRPFLCVDGRWNSSCWRGTQNLGVLHAWNALVTARAAESWRQAMLLPAQRHFPKIRLSMYGFSDWSRDHCRVPSTAGSMLCSRGSGAAALSVQAPVFYDEWLSFDCLHPRPWDFTDSASDCRSTPGIARGIVRSVSPTLSSDRETLGSELILCWARRKA